MDEKRNAVIRFNALMGFHDDDDDLVLKHIELDELLAVIENLEANPDTKDRAAAQYDKWYDEWQDVIADDPDADLSGLEEDDEDWDDDYVDEAQQFREDHPNAPGYFFGSEGAYWRDHDPEFGRLSGNSDAYSDY